MCIFPYIVFTNYREIANTLKQEQDERQRIEQEKAAEAEAEGSTNNLPSVKETAKSVSPKVTMSYVVIKQKLVMTCYWFEQFYIFLNM